MKHDRSPEDKPLVATRDIFTIPNAISLCGAALAWKGAETAETPKGTAMLIAGRGLDALDGKVARVTGQTSNFGALTDAGLDKIATAKIIYEFTKKGIIPREIAAALASLQTTNALATAATMLKYPGKSIRPTTSGKLAMAGEMAYSLTVSAPQQNEAATKRSRQFLGLLAGSLSLHRCHAHFIPHARTCGKLPNSRLKQFGIFRNALYYRQI